MSQNVRWDDVLEKTFQQHDFVVDYLYGRNAKHKFNSDSAQKYPPIVLVDKEGNNLIVDGAELDTKKHPNFLWAQESFEKLKKDIDAVSNESVWCLFRAQGGILGLCEKGAVAELMASLSNQKTYQQTPDSILGVCNDVCPIIAVNGKGVGDGETLKHELLHNFDNLGSFSSTPLFRTVLEIERCRHLIPGNGGVPPDVSREHNPGYMFALNMSLVCTADDKAYYPEMFVRLELLRLERPDLFKADFPLLSKYMENVAYSTLDSVVAQAGGRDFELPSQSIENTSFCADASKICDAAIKERGAQQEFLYEIMLFGGEETQRYKNAVEKWNKATIETKYLAHKCEKQCDACLDEIAENWQYPKKRGLTGLIEKHIVSSCKKSKMSPQQAWKKLPELKREIER